MPPYFAPGMECLGKAGNESFMTREPFPTFVEGAIIVGGGPSGLAAAACLKMKGVPSLIIEKSDGIGSLWKYKAYDRLHLHIPKQFCELPYYAFPEDYPLYPDRKQFVDYLENYFQHFDMWAKFNTKVSTASYDPYSSCWKVKTQPSEADSEGERREYRAKWLVVASGENAEPYTPEVEGLKDFRGSVVHSSNYKTGAGYARQRVLVVGCGNSGMEIALDLSNFNAEPSLVVRSPVHILPREIFGTSTFAVAMRMMKSFPLWFTDACLVWYTWAMLGDTTRYGFKRPSDGPMTIKCKQGKTPILDVGTFAKIKSGAIKVCPGLKYVTPDGALFENDQFVKFDAIVLATGYRSNVPQWLKDDSGFFTAEGLPKNHSKGTWKAERGLYIAGLGRKGILGATFDAKYIAEDLSRAYASESHKRLICPLQSR
ncbi:probable indole-3-pyruvate monooxygenase YUCCA5 [Physcomitrium patens]|uniref:Flavin-containing monooxygenase n=1 Tax=Physcomitrium patens TaxID=3218 RepID=A0A2K1JMV4_PHYPA|nr:probable indole-3-pyruvate monooxygenase YUCCA5 [Physcomitrium patens]PNR42869.1 hypothetical protein PHYPA_017701 [Physcomitrium patens]|eukprot:XP_024392067.1 probable indole-3-pyruvate monooxygenase YUCCA5 [Physcomitrella patens]